MKSCFFSNVLFLWVVTLVEGDGVEDGEQRLESLLVPPVVVVVKSYFIDLVGGLSQCSWMHRDYLKTGSRQFC